MGLPDHQEFENTELEEDDLQELPTYGEWKARFDEYDLTQFERGDKFTVHYYPLVWKDEEAYVRTDLDRKSIEVRVDTIISDRPSLNHDSHVVDKRRDTKVFVNSDHILSGGKYVDAGWEELETG